MSTADKFMDFAGKVGSQRHLLAIRDSFATLMPAILAGSVGTLLCNMPIGTEGQRLYDFWTKIGLQFFADASANIWWGAMGMMTLFIVFLMGYNLSRTLGGDPISGAIISFATYMAIVPQAAPDSGWGTIGWGYASANSLFVGILISCIATEIFVRLAKIKALAIKLPDSVPPAVSKGFAAVFPGLITMYIIVCVVVIIQMLTKQSFFDLISSIITTPLKGLSTTLPAAIVVVLMVHVLWIFGLHGPNILGGITGPLYMPLIDENMAAFAAGQPIPHIVVQPFFDAFVYIGGSGATLGLLIAVFMVAKSKTMRTVAKVSIGPGCFNINEPVVFGMPIVFNPILAIPFILAPVVMTIVAYAAMATGIVGKVVIITHWAMPAIISGFLATGGDIKGSILQIINLAISVAIFLPFVIINDRAELKREQA